MTALGGDGVFSIRTDDLRSPSDNRALDIISRHKPGRMVLLGSDSIANIFFRYEGDDTIYKWDVNTPFLSRNFRAVYSGDGCLLASHMTWDPLRGKARALMSNFLDFFQGTVGVGVVHVLRSIG